MALWTNYGTGLVKADLSRVDNKFDAYLCCPGPSLTDVPQGPGRTIYALNTAYPKVRPDVWIASDRLACFPAGVWFESFPKIVRYVAGDTGRAALMPNVFYADMDDKADLAEMFLRRDGNARFVWPHNTFFFALHFLIWVGHKTIRFVGCDLGGPSDYYDDRILTDAQRECNKLIHSAVLSGVRRLTGPAARNGITFVSSTRDSPLNEFLPYEPLSEALVSSAAVVPQARPLLHSTEADDRHEQTKHPTT